MLKLFDNAFSPFARKIRLVLDHKELDYDVVDGLKKSNHGQLAAVNPRVEVPCLQDGDITVVNSSDIVAHLEYRFPDLSIYPEDAGLRARARAWERTADTLVDSILTDISYWSWTGRTDSMPDGLFEAAQTDLDAVFDQLESDLQTGPFICGALSIADLAFFPHMTGLRTLRITLTGERHPRVLQWFKNMRGTGIFKADMQRTRDYMQNFDPSEIETSRIFWRGDRIEWILAKGYHDWFYGEIEADRVIWPGLSLPPGSR